MKCLILSGRGKYVGQMSDTCTLKACHTNRLFDQYAVTSTHVSTFATSFTVHKQKMVKHRNMKTIVQRWSFLSNVTNFFFFAGGWTHCSDLVT